MFPHPKCIQLPICLSPCASSAHHAGSSLPGEACQFSETQRVSGCVNMDVQALLENQGSLVLSFSDDPSI